MKKQEEVDIVKNEDLIRTNAVEIAYQIINQIMKNKEKNSKPFIPGQEDLTKNVPELAECIMSFHSHPKKNKVLLEYLNLFLESELS